jgi:N-methylhydantoinase A
VVPPCAGLFSSFGLLYADVEHHYGRTFRRLLRKCDLREVEAAWSALARQAREQLAAEGFSGARVRLHRSAALHYQGQTYELTVPVPDKGVDDTMVAYLEDAFGQEHERTYGHRAGPEEPVELVTIQLVGEGLRSGSDLRVGKQAAYTELPSPPPRRAYFGTEHGWMETPVMRRSELASTRRGPAIVEEYDATCVVAPGWCASLDGSGNIVIDAL